MAAINPEASFDTALVHSHLYLGATTEQFGQSAANERWPLSVTAAAGGSGWLRFTTLKANAVQEGWQINPQDGGLNVVEAGVGPAVGAGSSRLFLQAGGNVGIGTSTPKHTLEVNGTLNATNILQNGAPLALSQWDNASGGISYAGGNVGIGTATPTQKLHVEDITGIRQNRLYLSGGDGWSSLTYNACHSAENNSWNFPDQTHPAVTLEMDDRSGAGGRFEVYSTTKGNTVEWKQLLAIDGESGNVVLCQSGGSVGIGTVPNHRFHVVADRAVGLFESTGADAFLRLTTPEGLNNRVEITNRPGGMFTVWTAETGNSFRIDRAGRIYLGLNRSGGFVRLNDDVWFSDPQNGTIEIKNGNESGWGQMIGFFRPPCSLTYKKNVTPLDETAVEQLLSDTLGTRLFRYQYLEDAPERCPHVGLVAEESPAYLLGEEGKSLSPTAYAAMLHGAIKALAQRLASQEQAVQATGGA